MQVLDKSINEPVLQTLRRWAVVEGPRSGYTVDGYEVPTHPDLFDFLKGLVVHTPHAQFQYLFATPILHTTSGVIFATARGTSTLCLRLPGVTDWGRAYRDYGGEPWRQGLAWGRGDVPSHQYNQRLVWLLQMAYDSANTCSD
jgi:hypothetical protein